MTSEFRVALGISVGLHAAAVVGLPVTVPVAFDVERALTSVELYLAQPPERPLEPEEVIAEERDVAPQPVVSREHRGALTEALPSYFRNPPPVYPRLARERGQEGTVVLEVEVLPSGRCGTINVLSSSGYALLDQTALNAVRRWVFRPARRWNQRVSFWVEIPMTFRLVDEEIEF